MRNAILRKVLHIMLAVFAAFVLAGTVLAQQQNDRKPASNLLVRVLQAKGILTDDEAAMVSQASTADEAEGRLARLLLSKGIITQADYDQTVGSAVVQASADGAARARIVPAVLRLPASSGGSVASPDAQAAQKPAPAPVIPAVAPIRVFPVDPPKREGLVPDLKVGPVRLKPYGFFKTSVVWDSSSPKGDDFPLPGFIAPGLGGSLDTGPDSVHEFHLKARAMRLGSNFEWVDPSPKVAITGRFEFDFEGNFSRASNRNISTIRSSMAGIRLAWARVDYAASEHVGIHALFGQDWTPFASSTLPSLLETTGLGVGFGTLYERAPQARFGFTYNAGGSRSVKFQPEVAVVLPSYGNLPGGPDAGAALGLQLGFGERQGVDSGRPEVQGRIVTQFRLDTADGVPPAQLIFSAMQGERRVIVRAADVPAAFQAAFPNGASARSSRNGYTAEVQVPTRYATLIAKYYNGEDLRFYFGGQLFSPFNDPTGLSGVVSAGGSGNIDGSAPILQFATDASGAPVVVPQRPVRSSGGFVNLGLPLSRIFSADPSGRNNAWTLYLHYGIDFAKARDVRKFTAAGTGNRVKSDLASAQLAYKLNNWVTFAVEQSLYRTRAVTGTTPAGATILLPLFRGNRSREEHDLRFEFGTIFTF